MHSQAGAWERGEKGNKMQIVGLDFGTTNSILSYYDETKKVVESFKLGGVDGSNYIPSYLAISKDDVEEKYIGHNAKSEDREDYHIFSHFKMLLSEDDENKLSKYNYKNYSPKEIVKEYLKLFLNQYKEESKKEIKNIVITVPEIWLIDNAKSREILMQIIEELKLPLKELISEPMSAGGYFLHKFEEENKKRFSGNFIIFDYGGGTLDISLLRLEDDNLEVLERTGNGNSIENLGNAGTAYDEVVIQTIYEKNHNQEIDKNSQQYLKLLMDFEKLKIEKKDKIKQAINRYSKNNLSNKVIFRVSEMEITPEILMKSFEIFKENIFKELKNIEKYFDIHNINEEDRKKLKIIMVGGFSNFYLSQLAVKEFFNSKTEDDPRFNHNLTLEDTALAISKGATLFAKGLIKIKRTYPITLSLVYSVIDDDFRLGNKEWTFMVKGEEVNFNVNYSDVIFTNAGDIKLHFYMGNIHFIDGLDKKITFPNSDIPNNSWRIGFSIDRNNFIKMHIKDNKKGDNKIIDFGNLIAKYKNKLIAKG